jgi:hypothetical protein
MSGTTLFSAFFESSDGHDHDRVRKTRIASHLAKMAGDETRELLYAQKAALLCRAIELEPGHFAFTYWDERGIIGVRYTPTNDGFHLPADQLTVGARAAVVQSLTRRISSSKELRRVA